MDNLKPANGENRGVSRQRRASGNAVPAIVIRQNQPAPKSQEVYILHEIDDPDAPGQTKYEQLYPHQGSGRPSPAEIIKGVRHLMSCLGDEVVTCIQTLHRKVTFYRPERNFLMVLVTMKPQQRRNRSELVDPITDVTAHGIVTDYYRKFCLFHGRFADLLVPEDHRHSRLRTLLRSFYTAYAIRKDDMLQFFGNLNGIIHAENVPPKVVTFAENTITAIHNNFGNSLLGSFSLYNEHLLNHRYTLDGGDLCYIYTFLRTFVYAYRYKYGRREEDRCGYVYGPIGEINAGDASHKLGKTCTMHVYHGGVQHKAIAFVYLADQVMFCLLVATKSDVAESYYDRKQITEPLVEFVRGVDRLVRTELTATLGGGTCGTAAKLEAGCTYLRNTVCCQPDSHHYSEAIRGPTSVVAQPFDANAFTILNDERRKDLTFTVNSIHRTLSETNAEPWNLTAIRQYPDNSICFSLAQDNHKTNSCTLHKIPPSDRRNRELVALALLHDIDLTVAVAEDKDKDAKESVTKKIDTL